MCIYIYTYIYIFILFYLYTHIYIYVSTSLCLYVDAFLCMRRLGMDTAGCQPARGRAGTVKKHAFGTLSAPPLAEAKNNSS